MLLQKISNMLGTGQDNISYKESIDKLNKLQLEKIGTERTKERPINIINKKYEENQEKINLLKIEQNLKEENQEKINQLKKKINENKNKINLFLDVKNIFMPAKKQKNETRYTMEPITVKYKVLDARAKVPAYATPGAAAADLCAVLDAPLTVAPMQRVLVPTGLAIELPGAHSVALVYARSGLSIKHGLCMANGVGVVDSDYRGELKVPMVNLGAEAYTIQPGERVAQLCIAPVYTAAFVPAEELGDTQRGVGGFGSTGK